MTTQEQTIIDNGEQRRKEAKLRADIRRDDARVRIESILDKRKLMLECM